MASQGVRISYPQGAGGPQQIVFGSARDAENELFAPRWAGAITRTVADKLRDLPHVYDVIGESGRNRSDLDIPINMALAASGERFVLPSGTIRTGGPIEIPRNGGGLIGQGNSRIESTVPIGDILRIVDAVGGESSLVRLEDFTVWSTVAKTSGHALYAERITDAELINVRLGSVSDYAVDGHRLFKGLRVSGFSQIVYWDGEICTSDIGFQINGLLDANGNQIYAAAFVFDGGVKVSHSNNFGGQIGGAVGGLYLGTFDMSECRKGLLIDRSLTNGPNREIFTSAFASLDNLRGSAVEVQAGALAYWRGDGIWLSGCGRALEPVVTIAKATTGQPDCAVMLGSITMKENFGTGWVQRGGLFTALVEAQNNGAGSAVMGANPAGGDAFDFDNITAVTLLGTVGGTGNATKGYGVRLGSTVLRSMVGVAAYSNGQGDYINANALGANHLRVSSVSTGANAFTETQTIMGATSPGLRVGTNAGETYFIRRSAADGYLELLGEQAAANGLRYKTQGGATAFQADPDGVFRFGAFTANADAPVTGYITVRDVAGNTRKLAIIA